MTAKEVIVKYLNNRTTFATAKEIAAYTKLNYNTVRKLLGDFVKGDARKCRASGQVLTTYGLN